MGYSATILDRGFYSLRNLKDALALKIRIICGVIKDRSFREILLCFDRDGIYRKQNRVELKNTHVYVQSMDFLSGKLIVVYNPYLESIRKEQYYEHSSDEVIASLLVYSLIFHNTGMDQAEVVRKYYEKDTAERAFSKMKGILSLRPVRVRLPSRVYAHIKICYLSYAILSMLEYHIEKTGISGPESLEHLSHGYTVHLKDQESDLEWSMNAKLSRKREEIRSIVYKTQ